VLPVHRVCENTRKRDRDQLLKVVLAKHLDPTGRWNPSDLSSIVRNTPLSLVEVDGQQVPVMNNAHLLMGGAWMWVRGLYAALYDIPLDEDALRVIVPPVPAFSTQRSMPVREQIAEMTHAGQVVMQAVMAGIAFDVVDAVSAWGKSLRFWCVWLRGSSSEMGPLCAWTLVYPGVLEWSEMTGGDSHPWHGFFYAPIPTGASVIGDYELQGIALQQRQRRYIQGLERPSSSIPRQRRRRGE
jgi:hypothetical protein